MYSYIFIALLSSTVFFFNYENLFNDFTKIVVFGDSNSDTGNVYQLSDRVWPIVPPYHQGRYCDGPNWVDNLKVLIKRSFAHGCATSDSNLVQGFVEVNNMPVPGFLQQVNQYLASPVRFVSYYNIVPTLYVIWVSGNDILFNQSLTLPQIVDSISRSMKTLLDAGVKNVLVFNQAPAQTLPILREHKREKLAGLFTKLANKAIKKKILAFKSSYPKTTFYMFDLNALITKLILNSESTFTNTADPCWIHQNITIIVQNCTDPTKYIFLDSMHYSSTVQKQISDAIQPFITDSVLGSYITRY